ncbi:hypothetical protein L210DRAFT_3446785 [Boletus edulis BED1]|uniref:Uncharacterized protein n=1 Tax=Boletus edulis BED1 TaxID=1328754 RepID=A0AAD4GGL0_BOLED|nr:hypothetical protein L210DRAFT_3446785 [Boletus edulis BED1]
MQLSNDLAALIGFACEAVLWGINLTLFFVSLAILRHRPLSDNINNPVIYLNCVIFLCCTTHFALEFNHFYTILNDTGVAGFANETSSLVGADFFISFTDLLGDFVLIYRCWTIWGKNYYIIVLPFLTSIGGFACIIATLDILLATNPNSPTPPPALVPLSLAAYTLPLCTNVMVTSLIVYRIWYTSRTIPDSPQIGQGATRRAMMLIIESGALYLVFQFVFVVLVAISNAAEAIVAVMAVQIYGIAPTLIIIRVGLGISSENTSGTVASTRIKWVARHTQNTGESATNYTDVGLVTHTDLEGMKESSLSKSEKHENDTELGLTRSL